jgi:hypothetical protein
MKMTAFWNIALCSLMEVNVISEVCTASIIRLSITLMIEAVWTSEIWVYFNKSTQHYIPES